jgi:hypothetical protein
VACRGSAREPAAGQVGQAQPCPGGQRVSGGQRDQDRLGQQRLAVQAAVIEGAQQKPHVGTALAQRLRLLAESSEYQLRRQGRIVDVVGIEDLRQQAAVDVGLERDPQPPRRTARLPGPAGGGGDRL